MLQVFLVFLSAVTFVLMATDPRPTDSTQAKSAWTKQLKTSETSKVADASAKDKTTVEEEDSEQV
ncbi:hypothetical protein [Acinetobacter sp. WCHA29]|uniref:ABZJ_00068 family colistin stress protein n=1 Tax=Acinetobacter sp. WCHA29 TaxID=2004649 RepID=UPI000B3C1B92|nr:hypothetical protein [Acinetobacter sp. WCHA29]